MCITGDKREFIGKVKPLTNAVVKGITSRLKIVINPFWNSDNRRWNGILSFVDAEEESLTY